MTKPASANLAVATVDCMLATVWRRRSTIIAVVALVAILMHVLQRFALHASAGVYNLPLLATLVLGGVLLVYELDKTGTLTYSESKLTEQLIAPGFAQREVLALAASLEVYSKHPLARAILAQANAEALPLRQAEQPTTSTARSRSPTR